MKGPNKKAFITDDYCFNTFEDNNRNSVFEVLEEDKNNYFEIVDENAVGYTEFLNSEGSKEINQSIINTDTTNTEIQNLSPTKDNELFINEKSLKTIENNYYEFETLPKKYDLPIPTKIEESITQEEELQNKKIDIKNTYINKKDKIFTSEKFNYLDFLTSDSEIETEIVDNKIKKYTNSKKEENQKIESKTIEEIKNETKHFAKEIIDDLIPNRQKYEYNYSDKLGTNLYYGAVKRTLNNSTNTNKENSILNGNNLTLKQQNILTIPKPKPKSEINKENFKTNKKEANGNIDKKVDDLDQKNYKLINKLPEPKNDYEEVLKAGNSIKTAPQIELASASNIKNVYDSISVPAKSLISPGKPSPETFTGKKTPSLVEIAANSLNIDARNAALLIKNKVNIEDLSQQSKKALEKIKMSYTKPSIEFAPPPKIIGEIKSAKNYEDLLNKLDKLDNIQSGISEISPNKIKHIETSIIYKKASKNQQIPQKIEEDSDGIEIKEILTPYIKKITKSNYENNTNNEKKEKLKDIYLETEEKKHLHFCSPSNNNNEQNLYNIVKLHDIKKEKLIRTQYSDINNLTSNFSQNGTNKNKLNSSETPLNNIKYEEVISLNNNNLFDLYNNFDEKGTELNDKYNDFLVSRDRTLEEAEAKINEQNMQPINNQRKQPLKPEDFFKSATAALNTSIDYELSNIKEHNKQLKNISYTKKEKKYEKLNSSPNIERSIENQQTKNTDNREITETEYTNKINNIKEKTENVIKKAQNFEDNLNELCKQINDDSSSKALLSTIKNNVVNTEISSISQQINSSDSSLSNDLINSKIKFDDKNIDSSNTRKNLSVKNQNNPPKLSSNTIQYLERKEKEAKIAEKKKFENQYSKNITSFKSDDLVKTNLNNVKSLSQSLKKKKELKRKPISNVSNHLVPKTTGEKLLEEGRSMMGIKEPISSSINNINMETIMTNIELNNARDLLRKSNISANKISNNLEENSLRNRVEEIVDIDSILKLSVFNKLPYYEIINESTINRIGNSETPITFYGKGRKESSSTLLKNKNDSSLIKNIYDINSYLEPSNKIKQQDTNLSKNYTKENSNNIINNNNDYPATTTEISELRQIITDYNYMIDNI